MEAITPYEGAGIIFVVTIFITLFGLLIGGMVQEDAYFKWLGRLILLGFSIAAIIGLVGLLMSIQWT